MCQRFSASFVLIASLVAPTAFAGESAENRSQKTWLFEGSTGYRSYDVREYALGVGRFDKLGSFIGASSLSLQKIWTNRAYYGNRNRWKLDGYALSASYRKYLGNSFFAESSLWAETFEATAPAYNDDVIHPAEDYGTLQRVAMTIQCGNQWQWENLNFGITWFGQILPLSRTSDPREQNESLHEYLTQTANLGIRISLGWAL